MCNLHKHTACVFIYNVFSARLQERAWGVPMNPQDGHAFKSPVEMERLGYSSSTLERSELWSWATFYHSIYFAPFDKGADLG